MNVSAAHHLVINDEPWVAHVRYPTVLEAIWFCQLLGAEATVRSGLWLAAELAVAA